MQVESCSIRASAREETIMPADRSLPLMPTPGDLPCPECGYLNTPQSEVCGVCGQMLVPPPKVISDLPDQPPESRPTTNTTTGPEPNGK